MALWWLKFLTKAFKLLCLIHGALVISGPFLEHARELIYFFFCGWCLLGARGPSASSLLWEQQLQKYLQCNLMRLIKHCECKHDQIYRAACVPQPPGAAVDGDGDSHHLSLGKRAQLASQTSPCFYATLGIRPVGMQPG